MDYISCVLFCQKVSSFLSGRNASRKVRQMVNWDLSCHAGLDQASRGFRFVPTSIVKQKPTPPGSGSDDGATGGQSGKSQFTFLLSQRKSTIAVLHNNKKIGAKKCRRLNKPVSEYRSRILHTAIARQCSPPLAGNSF